MKRRKRKEKWIVHQQSFIKKKPMWQKNTSNINNIRGNMSVSLKSKGWLRTIYPKLEDKNSKNLIDFWASWHTWETILTLNFEVSSEVEGRAVPFPGRKKFNYNLQVFLFPAGGFWSEVATHGLCSVKDRATNRRALC